MMLRCAGADGYERYMYMRGDVECYTICVGELFDLIWSTIACALHTPYSTSKKTLNQFRTRI